MWKCYNKIGSEILEEDVIRQSYMQVMYDNLKIKPYSANAHARPFKGIAREYFTCNSYRKLTE